MSADESRDAGTAAGASTSAGGSAPGSSSKADAIWQQLKSAQGAPKTQGLNFNKLWHGFSSDPMQGKIKVVPKASQQQNTYEGQLVARTRPTQPAPQPKQQPYQQALATDSKPDPDTALQIVTRCVVGLKDSSQAARRKALQDVQSQLLDNPALGEQWLTERLEADGLGKALLRRFDDPADSCREMAVTNLLRLLQAAPQAVLSLLPYAFPVVTERIRHKEEGSKNLTEPCEEVRLALARLLRCLVLLGGKSFGGYAGEAVELVAALCEDPFYEVQEEACAILVAMNDVLGLRLQPVAKQLVAAVLPLTTAKRHRVRIAALQALRPTLHQGAHEMILEMVAWRDPNVIPIKAFYGDDLKVNFCGKLAADPHPAVRREFLVVLADWMTSLRERLDHEARLLPFVLSALNDETPEIQADAVALLERLGAQYEKDHEKDLKDTLSYLPAEAHGIGWQAPGAAGYVYGSVADGEETVNGGRTVFVLPGPLRSRPRLGTRRLVQSNFGRIVGALSEEVTSWLLEARRRAAALLRTQLILAEEWSEQHLHLLMPALCKAISDLEVRPLIQDCCAIIGAFTDPELTLQLLQPRVADEAADLPQRAAALEVLACVIRGAGPRRAVDPHMAAVLDLMCLESLLTSEDARMRRALHEVMDQMVNTCGPACGRHAARLLWVCLHLRAPGRTAQGPPAAAASAAATAAAAAATAAAAAAAASTATAGGSSLESVLGVGAAAGDAGGAAVEAVLMPRLAEVCGFSGGVDELVEAYRFELLAKLDAGSSPNLLLTTGVLCRLILPRAALSYLLYLPEEAVTRVLPPADPASPSTGVVTRTSQQEEAMLSSAAAAAAGPMEVDACVGAGAEAAGVDAAMEDRQAAAPSTALPSFAPLHWQPASTTAVLSHLASDLTWLPRQPRCATMCMVSLEACLANIPAGAAVAISPEDGLERGDPFRADAAAGAAQDLTPGSSAGELQGEGPGEKLLAVVGQSLAAVQDLPQPALLAALRCLHAVLRRGLVPGGVLGRHVGELVQRLGACAAVVSGAACRLQTCYVTQMLVRCPAVVQMLVSAAEGAALQGVCAAVSSRLYDAADEVRCAALELAKDVVRAVLARPAVDVSWSDSAPARLVAEILQLRDVSPGSAFYDEYHAFRKWANTTVPTSWPSNAADN